MIFKSPRMRPPTKIKYKHHKQQANTSRVTRTLQQQQQQQQQQQKRQQQLLQQQRDSLID